MAERRIILPNSNDCYDGSAVVVTCLTTDLDCPKDVECKDEADTEFKRALFRPAHYWIEYDYFEVFNVCLGALEKRTGSYSKESEQNQVYSTQKHGRLITLSFDEADRRVTMSVSYTDTES